MAGRTFFRQDAQIRNSVTYDDSITPSEAAFETNPAHIETDLNNIRSQLQNFLNRDGAGFPSGNWYDDLAAPSALEAGTQRGIDAINAAVHAVEKKRVLRDVARVGVDVTVGNGDNFVILGTGEIPAQTTAAVGAVTTLGTVVAAHGGTFGTHALDEVSGTNTLQPKNLMEIVDASSGDPILSSGRQIYGLLQSETATDGHTITDTTTTRVQISFVRPNSAYDDLEACPVADIEDAVINYVSRERVRLEDLNEQDFLKGSIADVPAGANVTRQGAYDGQGATAVNLTTNAILDLEGAGLEWQVRDDAEAILFRIIEGSAGGTSKVAVEDDVDEFDVDAATSDFLNGVSVDTGAAGTTINLGVTANQIDSGGALTVASGGAGDLTLDAANEMLLDDVNRDTSGFSVPLKVTETAAEWDQLETDFGEVSLASMLHQAYTRSGRVKGCATVTSNIAADTDTVGGSNLDVALPDYSGVDTFVDDVDVYLNGELLENGANAAANNDVYPGTTPASGHLKFEFALVASPGNPDKICMIVWNS